VENSYFEDREDDGRKVLRT